MSIVGQLRFIAAFFLPGWMICFQLSAAEFYVDSSAKAGGNGSMSAAFRSIQEGINRLGPGDTLYVRGDTSGLGRIYPETPVFPVSGHDGAPITIQSFPGEMVIVSTPTMIRLDRDYLVLKGLVFDHQNAASDAIRLSGDNIHLSDCVLRNGSRDGLDISAKARKVTVSNCVIHDFIWIDPVRRDAHCIVANPEVTGLRVIGNTIYNCSGDGIQLYANDATPVSSYVKDVLVQGNRIYSTLGSNSENGLDFKGGVDVVVEGNEIYGFTHNKAVVVQKGASNLRLVGNRIHDSARGAEFRWEGGKHQQDIIVAGNLFFNITGQYALKFDGVANVKVVHNTFHNNAGNSIRVENKGVNGGIIKNNLIHLSRPPRILGAFNADVSHNGWFRSSAGPLSHPGDTIGTDPSFVNLAENDFRLTAGSPAVDGGTYVQLPYVGRAPDLGAYEWAGDFPVFAPSRSEQ